MCFVHHTNTIVTNIISMTLKIFPVVRCYMVIKGKQIFMEM